MRRGRRSRLSRPGRTGAATTVRASDAADEQHLRAFATTRRGVEGFVEPRTAVSDVTLMLVAHDGEWTRRRVPSVAGVVGYPARMREYNRRMKQNGLG